MSLGKRLINTNTGGGVVGCYDITTATYQGTRSNVVASSYPEDVFVSPDGTRGSYCDGVGNIYNVALTTPYVFNSSSVFGSGYQIGGGGYGIQGSSTGFCYNNTGTRLYNAMSSGSGGVRQWAISGGNEWRPAGNVSYQGHSFSYGGIVNDVAMSTDGTRFFTLSTSTGDIKGYTLSSANHVLGGNTLHSTLNAGTSGSVSAMSIDLDSTGSKIFVFELWTSGIREYNMSTPYDLSTATAGNFFSFAAQDGNPRGASFSGNGELGNRLYMAGSVTKRLYGYNLCS